MPGCDPPRPETASSTHPATTKEKHEPAKPAAGGADHARQQKLTSQRIADMHCAFKDGEKGGLGVTLVPAEHTSRQYGDAFRLISRANVDALFVSVEPAGLRRSGTHRRLRDLDSAAKQLRLSGAGGTRKVNVLWSELG